MHMTLVLPVLFLIAVANGSPVLAKWILDRRWAWPIDGGACFADGRPVFGPSKTIRGLALSLLFTAGAAQAIGLGWTMGALIGAASMGGDLFSSFVKRRMGKATSAMALGLDQIPESLFPALVSTYAMALGPADVAAIVILFFIGELALSRLLFVLKIREHPY